MSSIEPLLERPWRVVAVFATLALVAAPGLLRLSYDNSPEAFFVRDAEALERYDRFEFDFGRDRALRIVLKGEGLWTAEGLAWLADLETEVGRLHGVLGAAGPYHRHRWRLDEWPPSDPFAFRAELLADPLDRQAGWISTDGRIVTVLTAFYNLPTSERRRLLADIEGILDAVPPGLEASMAGLPMVNRALDEALIEVAVVFFPLLALIAMAFLFVVFRRAATVAAPLGLVAVCQTVVFGAMGWAGVRLDLVVTLLVPVLFVITLATAVHLLAAYLDIRRAGLEPLPATAETFRLKAWPVLWTGLTTCVGFGSLATSPVPPVRALGVWSVFGFAFMTLAALTLYPALLTLIRGPVAGGGGEIYATRARGLGRRLAQAAVRRRRAVFAAFGLLGLLAVAGLPRLRIETNLLTYFRPDHPLRAELRDLENRGVGVLAAELVLAESPVVFDSPEGLDRLAELTRRLRREPLVLGAISVADLVAGVTRYRGEGVGAEGEQVREAQPSRTLELLSSVPELDRMRALLLNRRRERARVSILVPLRGFDELEGMLARARGHAENLFPGAVVEITGRFPLVLAVQRSLLRTMVTSVSVTLAVIALIFRLLLGSSALALRALVPNLWPVAFVLGAMGWQRIPVDSTTVSIAATVLGLAVDDTLHTLGSFRLVSQDREASAAACDTLERLAGAHTATAAILIAGFGVIGFSRFVPTARFGGLAALAILMALAADLLLVPALLAGASQKEIERLKPG